MKIIKVSGELVEFDISKVRKSIERTGASKEVIEKVLQEILPRVYEGMTTEELYKIVYGILKKQSTCYACRYNLRQAVLLFGPTGFQFEQYVASILRAYKYDAQVPKDEIEGSCVFHEIDVIAKKDDRTSMIEAKFRNDYKGRVHLKDVMATWARFLDLVDGAAIGKGIHFDEVWIVTNAKFSDRARKFGTCKGMHLVGWDFPPEHSFAKMVDFHTLYPITVLESLTQEEMTLLSDKGITLCKELSGLEPETLANKLDISVERAQEISKDCEVVIEGDDKK